MDPEPQVKSRTFRFYQCLCCMDEHSSVPQILDHPVSLRLLEPCNHQYPNHFKGIWKGLRLTCVSYVNRRPGYSAGAVWMNSSVYQILDHPVSTYLLIYNKRKCCEKGWIRIPR